MPKDRSDIFRQATGLAKAGRFDEANSLVRNSAAKPAKDAVGLMIRGRLAILANRPSEARTLLEKSIRIAPSTEAWLLLGRYHLRMVEDDAALAAGRAAIELDSTAALPRIETAAMLLEFGRLDEAESTVRPLDEVALADLPPVVGQRLRMLRASLAIQSDRRAEAIDLAREVLEDELRPPERLETLDLLARACDLEGRFQEAFEAADTRNRESGAPFDPVRLRIDTDVLIRSTDRASLSEWPIGLDDPRPVFVAGMPRSGTSLLDRIIDAHPLAGGVGELPTLERFAARLAAVRRPGPPPRCFGELQSEQWREHATTLLGEMATRVPDATRIVNKSLGNDRLLGLASRLFPGCRAIHIRRDPRDVAVSCFLRRFSSAGVPWTTTLQGIADAWRESERIMTHWKTVLDLPILEVRYEHLVRRPEDELPRIIEFLGLDWDDACRDFHRSGRPIRTLSFDQVNRPLYSSSVGRHANYAEAISTVDWPDYDEDDG